MGEFSLLLGTRLRVAKNSLVRMDRERALKLSVFLLLGGLFSVGLYYIMHEVLVYLKEVDVLGPILMKRLLSMAFLTFLVMLFFSNAVTALATLYLSSDLELLVSSPVGAEATFLYKSAECLVHSSWAIILFGLPIFLAYGRVNQAPVAFYFLLPLLLFPFVVIPACLGIMPVMFLARFFSARRARQVLIIGGVLMISLLCVLLRLLRPERLLHPEAFGLVSQYLTYLKTPVSPYLPSYWMTEVFMGAMRQDYGNGLFYFLLMLSTAGILVVVSGWLAQKIYYQGWAASSESQLRGRPRVRLKASIASHPLLSKDIRLFFRDKTVWPQLLVLLSLVVIYLFNIHNLPLETIYLKNLISFLNLGFAGFVLAAIGTRFVFPAVSLEGRSFWIIKHSPLPMWEFLRGKFWISLIPILVLSEILVVVSNILLGVDAFFMTLSVVTIFFVGIGLTTLGVGIGAMFPKFEVDNTSQISTGFGGMIYMILALIYVGLVLLIEAGPVYVYFSSRLGLEHLVGPGVYVSLLLFTTLNLLVYILPMRMGLKALSQREI